LGVCGWCRVGGWACGVVGVAAGLCVSVVGCVCPGLCGWGCRRGWVARRLDGFLSSRARGAGLSSTGRRGVLGWVVALLTVNVYGVCVARYRTGPELGSSYVGSVDDS
jgi:hypothetical protein